MSMGHKHIINIFLTEFRGSDKLYRLRNRINEVINRGWTLYGAKPQIHNIETDKHLEACFRNNSYIYLLQLDDYDLPEIDALETLSKIEYKKFKKAGNEVSDEYDMFDILDEFKVELSPGEDVDSSRPFEVNLCFIDVRKIPTVTNFEVWEDDTPEEKATQLLSLERFLRKYLRMGKIVFWGRKYESQKDRKTGKTLNKKLNIIEDFKAILTSYILSKAYHVFDFFVRSPSENQVGNEESRDLRRLNWAEKILNSLDHGVALIDCNGYILWVNNKRRKFFKNNILGKRCLENIFGCHMVCKKCYKNVRKKAFHHEEERVEDYLNRSHYINIVDSLSIDNYVTENIQNGRLSYVRVARLIDKKHVLDEARKDILRMDNYSEILDRVLEAFNNLGFPNVHYFEAFTNHQIDRRVDSLGFNEIIGYKAIGRCENIVPGYSMKYSELPQFCNNKELSESLNIIQWKDEEHSKYRWAKDLYVENTRWAELKLIFQGKLIGLIGFDKGDELLDEHGEDLIDVEFQDLLEQFGDFIAATLNSIQEREVLHRLRKLSYSINNKHHERGLVHDIMDNICEDIGCVSMAIFRYSPIRNLVIQEWIHGKGQKEGSEYYTELADETYNVGEHVTGMFMKHVLDETKNSGKKNPEKYWHLMNIDPKKTMEFHDYDNGAEPLRLEVNNNFLSKELAAIKKYMGVKTSPLHQLYIPMYGEELLIGCIRLTKAGTLPFSWHDRILATIISSQVTAIVNRIWEHELQEDLILQIAKRLKSGLDINEICEEVTRTLVELTQCDFASIYLLDDDNVNRLKLAAATANEVSKIAMDNIDNERKFQDIPDAFDPEEPNQCGWMLFNYEMLRIDDEPIYMRRSEDIHNNKIYSKEKSLILSKAKSAIYTKLWLDEKPIGILRVISVRKEAIFDDYIRYFKIMGTFLEMAFRSYEEMKRMDENMQVFQHEMASLANMLLSQADRMRYQNIIKPEKILRWNLAEYQPETELMRYCQDYCKEKEIKEMIPVQRERFERDMKSYLDLGRNITYQIKKYYAFRNFSLIRFLPHEAIKEILGLLESKAKNKCLSFHYVYSQAVERSHCTGYKEIFDIAVYNVLDNAIKYADKDSMIDITLSVLPSEKRIIVTVSDYGLPISPEEKEKIFEKGYRSVKAQMMAPGMGFGLFNIKKLLSREVGGTIEIDSLNDPTTLKVIFFYEMN